MLDLFKSIQLSLLVDLLHNVISLTGSKLDVVQHGLSLFRLLGNFVFLLLRHLKRILVLCLICYHWLHVLNCFHFVQLRLILQAFVIAKIVLVLDKRDPAQLTGLTKRSSYLFDLSKLHKHVDKALSDRHLVEVLLGAEVDMSSAKVLLCLFQNRLWASCRNVLQENCVIILILWIRRCALSRLFVLRLRLFWLRFCVFFNEFLEVLELRVGVLFFLFFDFFFVLRFRLFFLLLDVFLRALVLVVFLYF